MTRHPEMVSGEGGSCTELMRAMESVAVKTGAEGVFVAIVPEKRLGIAVKVADGTTRASECAIAALLARIGVLNPEHPAAVGTMTPTLRNWDGLEVGALRPSEALLPR
jgi:L-asparaginase II